MLPFIELNEARPMIDPSLNVLRSADYQQYLDARGLTDNACQRARDIDARADAVLEEHQRLGREVGLEMAAIEQAALLHGTRLHCDAFYRQVDRQMSEVVRQAVCKVLGQYPDIELTLAATRQALARVQPREALLLHVRPDQLSEVSQRLDEVLALYPEVGSVEVCADARLARGGCRLETAGCVINASIEGQLAALQRALTQRNLDDEAGAP
ncbi:MULTISPECIES: HrpE/YscL family type III secretion apparatus protein [Pseudomonas]|jgi:type III secretion protein L|uniref:Type 3 secretion system stator protein n=1 Tax=Pseudomonas mosselii TaxID=78327 RepID=A0A7W2JVN2_9PSED|nr:MULTISPECIES: HrpE/YscL family type III secretion apparatus protein [Pseudomonas]MBA6066001.1 HrpE/YscL family type III secretion apparatus protein [Pseudomonas mosselii]MBS9760562.1 HrpE/YscL family type III secretion apparatus protein [Pseudomonas mosselii]OWQ38098.1 type III secretion system protein [Pseudomonas sp. DrBHI1]